MDIKKPQLVKVGAFAYFFEGVLQHPPTTRFMGHEIDGCTMVHPYKSYKISCLNG